MDRKYVILLWWGVLGLLAVFLGRYDLVGSALGAGAIHLWLDELYEREKRGLANERGGN